MAKTLLQFMPRILKQMYILVHIKLKYLKICLSNTGNLTGILKTCTGARVMLTYNQDIGVKLINGLMGTVKCLDRVKHNNTPFGTIYVKFDDPQIGNKLKD